MKISQMLASGRPLFSFEFFPPKDEAASTKLYETVVHLKGSFDDQQIGGKIDQDESNEEEARQYIGPE